ncbi:MAG: fasciclin domain-containing protein [Planctomycetota bacterium]
MSLSAMIVAAAVATAGPCGSEKASYGGCGAETVASSCGGTQASVMNVSHAAAAKNIVETAASAGQFNTLLAAATAAGLADVLGSDGPFTVFAPTDEAFAKLPAGTVESLLKPENKATLKAILKYHVVSGRLDAGHVTSASALDTVNGQRAGIEVNSHGARIAGVNIIKTDISASNGIIHVVDSVMMPSTKDLVDTAVDAGSFTTLAAAVKAAGLVSTLQSEGPFTVFAPTDEAFAKLPAGTVESLLRPENRDQLKAVLLFHVVPGRVYADQALSAGTATTAQGEDIAISAASGRAFVNGARILSTDIDATNGVIHVIDTVLIPG